MQGARSLGLTSVTILALSSVPALAISLGTQQLIRDISDGFSLFLDGQLKVGDHCTIGTPKSGKIDGTVLSMGMRSICLRLKNGSQLSMPNSQVAGSVVTNHSLRSAEPIELRRSIPKLETQALADLQNRAQALLTGTQDLASASTARGLAIACHRCCRTPHLLIKLQNHHHLQGSHAPPTKVDWNGTKSFGLASAFR